MKASSVGRRLSGNRLTVGVSAVNLKVRIQDMHSLTRNPPYLATASKHIAALERVKQDESDQRSRPAHQKAGNRTERTEGPSRCRFAAIKRGSRVLLSEHLKGNCFKTSKRRPTEQGHSRS